MLRLTVSVVNKLRYMFLMGRFLGSGGINLIFKKNAIRGSSGCVPVPTPASASCFELRLSFARTGFGPPVSYSRPRELLIQTYRISYR